MGTLKTPIRFCFPLYPNVLISAISKMFKAFTHFLLSTPDMMKPIQYLGQRKAEEDYVNCPSKKISLKHTSCLHFPQQSVRIKIFYKIISCVLLSLRVRSRYALCHLLVKPDCRQGICVKWLSLLLSLRRTVQSLKD